MNKLNLKKPVAVADVRSAQAKAFAKAKESPKAGTAPAGFTRLTLNMDRETHLALKIEAARQRFSMSEIINGLVKEHLKSTKR
jgi:predicted HicB family RNase H-like nuclease